MMTEAKYYPNEASYSGHNNSGETIVYSKSDKKRFGAESVSQHIQDVTNDIAVQRISIKRLHYGRMVSETSAIATAIIWAIQTFLYDPTILSVVPIIFITVLSLIGRVLFNSDLELNQELMAQNIFYRDSLLKESYDKISE